MEENQTKLYIGNLSYGTDEAKLTEYFMTPDDQNPDDSLQEGDITNIFIIRDKETKRSKGFGFAEMKSPELAQKVINRFNETTLDTRNLRINLAQPQEKPRQEYGSRW